MSAIGQKANLFVNFDISRPTLGSILFLIYSTNFAQSNIGVIKSRIIAFLWMKIMIIGYTYKFFQGLNVRYRP